MERIGHIVKGISALLIFAFLLFSIGVPIVVASCPMSKPAQRSVCDQCPSGSGSNGLAVGKYADRSCCATVFAAGRNTVEYLLLNHVVSHADHHAIVLPSRIVAETAGADPLLSANQHSSPSPPREDIPLLVSSLLI